MCNPGLLGSSGIPVFDCYMSVCYALIAVELDACYYCYVCYLLLSLLFHSLIDQVVVYLIQPLNVFINRLWARTLTRNEVQVIDVGSDILVSLSRC
jgi:hypothetical protein